MTLAPDDVPRRYLGLAGVLSAVLLVSALAIFSSGLGTVSVPGDGTYVQEFSRPLLTMTGLPLSVVAPLVALSRPWWGWLVALLPFVGLVVDEVWPFTAFAGVVAVALVAQWRHPVGCWCAAVPAMVYPATLLGGTTMTMPGGNLIYLADSSLGKVVTVVLFAVGAALVLAAGHGYRLATERDEFEAGIATERREVSNESSALSERARLARDLHDVVAHHVSLIAVRAETAPYTVPDLSDGARAAFAGIADDARHALDELRGVLGVLRRADGSVDLAPQPTGGDVTALVTAAGTAGDVTYVGAEHLVALGDATGHVVYRVVQEALTNARRHAPGASVRISATPDPDGLVVRVANPVPEGTTVVPGAGLTGMRERVEAIGGAFSAEIVDGELVVETVLPS